MFTSSEVIQLEFQTGHCDRDYDRHYDRDYDLQEHLLHSQAF